MIFAAGLGTRLKPLTDRIPKALVPVNGIPMLQHVILKLKQAGFTEIVINIHHFGEQIISFLQAHQNFGIMVRISDEREELLDTGGGIKKAIPFFSGNEPFLVHNVDILSDTDLKALYDYHRQSTNDATLLVSQRETSRYLLFDKDNARLCGWINKQTLQPSPTVLPIIPNNMKRMPSAVSMSSHLPSSGIWTDIGPGNFPLPTSIFKPAKKHASVDT